MTRHESTLGAIAAAIVAPPTLTYLISSAMNESGLDIFSILLIEALGFAAAVVMMRPRAWNAVLAGLLYFVTMTIFILWVGYRAGYYDLP
jgi:hypothetical protein